MKTQIKLLLVLMLGWVMVGCTSLTVTTTSATPTLPPIVTFTPVPTTVPTSNFTPTPIDLGPLPSPPPTAVPKEVSVELVGVISSEAGWVLPSRSVFEPVPYRPPYHYIVITMYVTQVLHKNEYVKSGDTIILHDYYHLSPNFSTEQLQTGMTFHIRGTYQVDTGVMPWAEVIESLDKTTIYEPPPVIGSRSDLVRITLNVNVETHPTNNSPELFVGTPPILWIIDENWAQVITGTVRLGEIIGHETTAEILKTQP